MFTHGSPLHTQRGLAPSSCGVGKGQWEGRVMVSSAGPCPVAAFAGRRMQGWETQGCFISSVPLGQVSHGTPQVPRYTAQ